eukprot:1479737-Amphidinium_carterae.1
MRWLLATLTLQLPSLVASLILHERHLTTRDANHSRVALPAEQSRAQPQCAFHVRVVSAPQS